MSATDVARRPVLRAQWISVTDARGDQRLELRWSSTPTTPATSQLASTVAAA